ncbi:MAG: MerR family transcriptional regulator [Rickettsiales bacterium]
MQLNFLQEDLLATLQESKQKTASKAKNVSAASVPDLFGGLPLAMPPEKPSQKLEKKDEEAVVKKATEEEHVSIELNKKSATAFKTISEASALLNVPQHVLRFWESRFSQIKPLKMGGGRRYYRPEDIDILSKIHNLLYKQGYTIKGAKKAFELKEVKPMEIKTVPETSKSVILTDKQRKQVSAIRQELLGLREKLRPYIADSIPA